MADEPLPADTKREPYWWDRVPRPELPRAPLPARADVVVIGSGYTGLSAALQTARGGRDTVVLDAADAGFGCSTRNGGQISTSVKPDFAELARRHGADRAVPASCSEGHASLAWVAFLRRRRKPSTAISASSAASTPRTARRATRRWRASWRRNRAGLEVEAHMVPRAEQLQELGTDAYHGGVVFTRHASVDPARFHQGMLDRVLQAGARVIPHCAATAIERDGAGTASRPQAAAASRRGNVVVATNGYTGTADAVAAPSRDPDRQLRHRDRRRCPRDHDGAAHAAEPHRQRHAKGGLLLPRLARLQPDPVRRPSSLAETDPLVSGPRLKAELVRLFPELAGVGISHSWCGFVAYTFDTLAHVGERDGVFYAMGYCGSGVGMAGYLGMRIGQKLLGRQEGATAFDGIAFQTRPFYSGNPWFLGPSLAYYRWRDGTRG